MFTTLGGTTPQSRMPRKESWPMAFGYDADVNYLVPGTPVKLQSDGTVTKCAAGTDFPIGVVDVGGPATYDDDKKVTVLTYFNSEVMGVADGVLAIGDKVICTGLNGTTNAAFPKYKKTTTAGHFVIGIVLQGGADTTSVKIGILRAPYQLVS